MADKNFFDKAYSLKSTQETREMYDQWSKVYDSDLGKGEYQQPTRCAKALAAQVTDKDISILDVGCGTGLSGLALKETGFSKIDGCDLSQGMLDKAKKLNLYNKLFTCNLNEPPIEANNESYDGVTAVGVFSFGHIMPDAVDELLRILKQNGTLIIGLNDHYFNEGSLTRKLDTLGQSQTVSIISKEHGEHIPANGLMGWVITLKKL